MTLEEAVQALEEDQIVQFIESHGGSEDKRNDSQIWFTTICHGGDSSKLCFFRDTRMFYCYTHCGSMTFRTLVEQVLNITSAEAFRYVIQMAESNRRKGFGLRKKNRVNEFLADLQHLKKLKQLKPKKRFIFTPANQHALECYESNVFYDGWCDEGISIETMQEFGIRWDELNKAIIIPHYDVEGNLIGIRARNIDATHGKYMPVVLEGHCYNHPLGMNLYGLNLHKSAIRSSRQAIIVEGEKSVMKHHTWFSSRSNMVATCGFNITTEQRELLLKEEVEEVVIAFDKDVRMNITEEEITSEYERYCDRINQLGRTFAPYCRVTALVDMEDYLQLKDAPLDRGKDTFLELMAHRQEITC